jgi:hypothetical protein
VSIAGLLHRHCFRGIHRLEKCLGVFDTSEKFEISVHFQGFVRDYNIKRIFDTYLSEGVVVSDCRRWSYHDGREPRKLTRRGLIVCNEPAITLAGETARARLSRTRQPDNKRKHIALRVRGVSTSFFLHCSSEKVLKTFLDSFCCCTDARQR